MRMRRCKRCLSHESGVAGPVLIQLTVNGPLHVWQRFDFASNYMGHFETVCGRNVLINSGSPL